MAAFVKIKRKIHFIGIGGIGTSALARWFLSHNFEVSGSDISDSPLIKELRKQGIKIYIGHRANNVLKDVKSVVYSEAIGQNNPEIRRGRKLRVPVKPSAEVLGNLTKKYKTIAVAGAHGKGTTTAFLSLILIQAGFDPSVIIGTKLKQFKDNNFRNGKSEYLILEADEYQKKFLNYSPYAAIITNIDREHVDCYKNLTDIKNTFLKFIGNIRRNGILVVNKDDKNLFSLKNKIQKIAKKNNLRLQWYGIEYKLEKFLKIPGQHIISDASAAYTLARALAIKDKDIFAAVSTYNGAWRRMEYKGRFKIKDLRCKIDVYDDYAHHPTEIEATLAGIAQKWPKTALICVFQPHQAKRLAMLFKEFKGAFFDANYLILLDIYKVAGRDKVSHNINSEKLARAINQQLSQNKKRRLNEVVYLPYFKQNELSKILKNIIINSKFNSYIIVMMGAGDIYKLTDKLVK